MSKVFLCHRPAARRSPDKRLVEKLANELKVAGHQVWYDEWEIGIGDCIPGKISEGFAATDCLVLCYSSSGDSSWTRARSRARQWQSTLARQLSGEEVKILPAFISGGTVPAILAGVKYMDMVKDWAGRVGALLRAIG